MTGVEQVAIESVGIGDFVFTHQPAPGVGARCVVAKTAKTQTSERNGSSVGSSSSPAGGLAWWPHGATVWRRRYAFVLPLPFVGLPLPLFATFPGLSLCASSRDQIRPRFAASMNAATPLPREIDHAGVGLDARGLEQRLRGARPSRSPCSARTHR